MPKYQEDLKALISAKELSQADVASAIGVNIKTVNGWFSKGQFGRSKWAQFAEMVGLDPDVDPFETYGIKMTTWKADFDRGQKRNGSKLDSRTVDLYEMFAGLKASEAFAFHSLNVMPLEWQDENVLEPIARAMERGARFFYIFLNAATVNHLETKYKIRIIEQDAISDEFEVFCGKLARIMEQGRIEDALRIAFVDHSPFGTFGETIGGFWNQDAQTRWAWKITRRFAVGESQAPPFEIAANKDFVEQWKRFVGGVFPNFHDLRNKTPRNSK